MAIFGSAFWGPSDAQQDAEGFFPAQGAWNTQQYKDWLDRAIRYGQNAENWGPWAVDYFQNVATHGIGTPDDVRAYGDWIMPGRQQVVDSRTGRLNSIGQDFENTAGGMQQRWGELGRGIGQNYDAIQGDINDAFRTIGQRGDAVHGDVIRNIGDTFGGARGSVQDTMTGLRKQSGSAYDDMSGDAAALYGGLQGRSTGRFGDLQGRSNSEYTGLQGRSTGKYDEMQNRSNQQFGSLQNRATGRIDQLGNRTANMYGGLRTDVDSTIKGLQGDNRGAYTDAAQYLQELNPAGDAAAARATRSWAPQIASTLGRLRAAGIDANSPEAASVLGRVKAQQSRAVEDAYTDAARNYVDRATSLRLDQEGVNRDLGMEALARRQGLGQQEEAIGRDLGLTEEDIYRNLGLGQLQNYLGLSQNELQNYQDLALGRMKNYQDLGLGELQNNQGLAERGGQVSRDLATQRLMNDQGLTERMLGMDTDLLLRGGDATRNELVRNLGYGTEADMNRLNATTGNRNNAFQQGWNWTQGQNTLDQNTFGQRSDLARERNAEDLWGYGFNVLQPWQMGNDWLTQQERIRSGAAGPVLNAGNAAAGQSTAAAQTARGFGGDAASNFGQTIATEAPNAGWGSKMIAGAASAGLGMMFPGAAGMFGGIAGGIPGGGGGMGGYGGYGGGYGGYNPSTWSQPYGGGVNPYNPMVFGMVNPSQDPRAMSITGRR